MLKGWRGLHYFPPDLTSYHVRGTPIFCDFSAALPRREGGGGPRPGSDTSGYQGGPTSHPTNTCDHTANETPI